MKLWTVVCCYNGEHEKPAFFKTYKEAYDYMENDYNDMLESYPDLKEVTISTNGISTEINDCCAWLEEYECQCYWSIFEVEIPKG